MIELLFALGRMVGLGTAAGMRPSLTIAVLGMMHHLNAGVTLNPTFSFLGHWVAIIVFVVLAIIEAALDKIPRFDRVQGWLSLPYRVAMGGFAGASTIPYGWQGIVIGSVVAALVAWFALYARQLSRPKTAPSDAALILMSLLGDLAAFATAMATLVFSPFGYLAIGFTASIYWRTRYLRRAKYRRMARRGGRGGGSPTDWTQGKE